MLMIIAFMSYASYLFEKEQDAINIAYDDLILVKENPIINIGITSAKKEYEEAIKNYENSQYVFKQMTRDELIKKINKNLNSTVRGKGNIFVDYSLEYGVDPILATSIMLHETGCTWECSYLARVCNNYGGQKGGPSCGGGSYASFKNQEEGIKAFIRNIANNYVKYGLTDANSMASKYATSKTWEKKVNAYYSKIERS